MCLLVVAFGLHHEFDLLVGANRDERHDRPGTGLERWSEFPGMVAGRDLQAGGAWLAVDAAGRFAAVTNFRDEEPTARGRPSRGQLVTDFMAGSRTPADHMDHLARRAADYAGFNLLVADRAELWYASNRAPGFAWQLRAGVHGLSNHLLDTAWPKLERSKQGLRASIDAGGDPEAPLFSLLAERQVSVPPPGKASAGATLPWPAASGPFIAHDTYGTRCSTVVARDAATTRISERRFGPRGEPEGVSAFRCDSLSRITDL